MEKFDSLSGKIPIKPLYFGSKQHTSLEGEPRDYNNHNFYNTNFYSKFITNWVWEFKKGTLEIWKYVSSSEFINNGKENDN